ncbi:MAG: ATP-binding protein [Mycoplasmataceae bacterium]|nr:ATP-binding protein [Mycoplasmataceae bacterium]
MDQTVLLEKRKNLLDSGKNTSELFLNNHFIDLSQLFNELELIDFIESTAITQLKVNKNELVNKVTTVINNAKDSEELSAALVSLHFNKSKSIEDKTKLIKDVVNYKLELIDELLEYSLKAKLEYYDTSIWTLHMSYGLLEGVVTNANHEGLFIRAPLINIEIEVIRDGNGDIILHKLNDQQFANGILEFSLDEQLEKTTLINESINQDIFNANQYFNYFTNILPNVLIDNNYSQITKVNVDSFRKNTGIKISKTFFASLINPSGAKMLRDYDEILSRGYKFPIYDTIFHKDLNHLVFEQDQIYEINNPLNLTQKLAIVNSQNKNTLIYGPPGTGKSEVVANLIANLLLNNKNIVVISEKKAALDVLDNRLLSISDLSMSAFDEHNSDIFYKKILRLNHLILASNKIDFDLQNQDYINLLDYQKLMGSLVIYIDINKKTIYDILSAYDRLDLIFYQRNIDVIKFIFNKLALDKININDFIESTKLIYEINKFYVTIFGTKQIHNNAYNYERVKAFLDVFVNVSDDDQTFVISKFVLEDEILEKKSMFKLRNKSIQNINVHAFLETFHKIIDNKLTYLVNFKKIFAFFNENKMISEYISLYDWLSNTDLQKLIDLIKNANTSQHLINKYWDYHKIHAQHTDEIIRDFYINNLKEKLLANHQDEIKWTELVRIANLSKRPNVNKIIKEYYLILRNVFPIWILSPEAASSIIPLNENEFDYGIFDEASQMRIERGIPLIYRCRFSIVSGDDKQLKPTSFFARATSLDESYDGHFDNVDSLLDKAKSSNWMSFTLDHHYRSVNEQLIKFSSHYFYNDELICITKNGKFKKSIELFDEIGNNYDRENGINIAEANRVIQILLNSINLYKNIIVVTFNIKQADYVQRLALNQPQLREHLEQLSLKIRSLENVQGDEGDLVIISCTFGKDKGGKFLQNFGPINQTGGKNRINVMISRAKEKMIIIKSFMSSDITNDKNENTLIFKKFISYVENINSNTQIITNKSATIPSNDANVMLDKLASELSLDNSLIIEKYKKIGSHTMDLAISKTNNPSISLCVLIDDNYDNECYSKNKINWISSIDRQKYYEDRGYHTYRLNLLELAIDRRTITNMIRQQII